MGSSSISCVLCKKSEETETTGALSCKETVAAHQNCLLFASGIYCKNSPTYDDLFGFAVEDVKKEFTRGLRLKCHHCKKNGATAGCEVKQCKRSYHLPCALEDHARTIEDKKTDRYILYCKKHDPQNRTSSVNGASPSGSNCSERDESAHCRGRLHDRNGSHSRTGSNELERPRMKKRRSNVLQFSDSDKEMQRSIDSVFAPIESDPEDDATKQHNSPAPKNRRSPEVETPRRETFTIIVDSDSDDESQTQIDPLDMSQKHSIPVPENRGTGEEPKPSTSGSGNMASTSGLNRSERDGSTHCPGGIHVKKEIDLPELLSEVETPRRKRKKLSNLSDSSDETPSVPKQISTPVPENRRTCEVLEPSAAVQGADGDENEIDSDESLSLLASRTYHFTVPCTVIVDSGPSMESENSLEPCSPTPCVPPAECSSPGPVSAPDHQDAPPTSKTPPSATAATADPASSVPADPMAHRSHSSHSTPTVDISASLTVEFPYPVEPLPVSHSTPGHTSEPSASPDLPTAADEGRMDAVADSGPCAATFWVKCNEAGCTKEIFTDLVSRLSSLAERVESQEASEQDYDVALNVLKASGRLPKIITQLEEDLEQQEQDLQRKKTALKDAKAFLGVHSLN